MFAIIQVRIETHEHKLLAKITQLKSDRWKI